MPTSTAMMLLMNPGPAFFYGGMVRSKNLLTTLYVNFISIILVTVAWSCHGYGPAFGNDLGGAGLIGWGILYGFVVTFIIGKVVDVLFRMRAAEEEQHAGSDAGFAAG